MAEEQRGVAPSGGTETATKNYVDNSLAGIAGLVPVSAYVATSESTATTTYTDLTTTTDQVTVTIGSSGVALVFLYSEISANVQANSYCSFAMSGANTLVASDIYCLHWTAAATFVGKFGAPFLLTGLSAGSTTFKMKYKAAGATSTFADRRIAVTPLNSVGLYTSATSPTSGPYASLPGAGSPGRIYFCTDTGRVLMDNGASWGTVGINDSPGVLTGSVPTTGWTGVNMGTGTFAADLDGMLFTKPVVNASTDNLGFQYRTYPAAPFALVVEMECVMGDTVGYPLAAGASGAATIAGLAISDGTKYQTVGPGQANLASYPTGAWYSIEQCLTGYNWSSNTLSAGALNTWNPSFSWMGGTPKWYRFRDDGTNRYWDWSLNGTDWNVFYSTGRTTYLTPTRIGVVVDVANYSGTSSFSGKLRLRSWYGVA